MNFLKIIHERVFRNENLSNLENILQKNVRTDRVREYLEAQVLKISLVIGLPKKTLDASLLECLFDSIILKIE